MTSKRNRMQSGIDRKSHMGFPFVPKSVTLNDLERRNGRYSVASCANYVTLVEVSLSATKNVAQESIFRQYMNYGDIFRK